MFKKILDKAFNQCPPDKVPDDVLKNAIEDQCNKNDLEGTKHFLSKVQEVKTLTYMNYCGDCRSCNGFDPSWKQWIVYLQLGPLTLCKFEFAQAQEI